MGDLRVGSTRPRLMFYGIDEPTGLPGVVKDIYYGSEWVWSQEMPDRTMVYTTAGTRYYQLPDYPVEIDVVVIGGGGGGQVGNGGNNTNGKGGRVGTYTVDTLTGINGGEIKIVVGAAGAGGNPGAGNGGASSVAVGFKSISAAGGQGGGASGQAGTHYGTFPNYFSYNHGVSEGRTAAGGRGGTGGFFGHYTNGESGSPGYAWFRIRKVMPY